MANNSNLCFKLFYSFVIPKKHPLFSYDFKGFLIVVILPLKFSIVPNYFFNFMILTNLKIGFEI